MATIEEIRATFDLLWQEVTSVHHEWGLWCDLFSNKQEYVDLLNATTPTVFRTIQDAILNDVIVQISRLTDPPTTHRGKSVLTNLTLLSLRDQVDHEQHPVLVAKLEQAIEAMRKAAEVPRQYRNKRIAHLDRSTYEVCGLPPLTKNVIDSALKSVTQVMELVEGELFNGSTTYHLQVVPDDAALLISYLDAGKSKLHSEYGIDDYQEQDTRS